tara:strand:- start:1402 stop:1785 length:384 start_codon:yes stop_codon:yes gene_type:complete
MIFIILFNLYFSTFYNTIEHFDNSGNDISNNDFNDFISKHEEKINTYHDEVLHNNTLNLNIPNIDISGIDISGIDITNVNDIITDIFSDTNTSNSSSVKNNSNFNYLTQVPCMSSTYKDQFKLISGF